MSQAVQANVPPKKYRFRHGRVYLVEQSWDADKPSSRTPHYQYTENDDQTHVIRSAIIIYAANARDMAETYCINGNKACLKCPERTANHTKYKVLERSVPSEYRFESDS